MKAENACNEKICKVRLGMRYNIEEYYLKELIRLAEIGRYAEIAVNNGIDIWCDGSNRGKVGYVIGINGICGLIKWGKEQEVKND